MNENIKTNALRLHEKKVKQVKNLTRSKRKSLNPRISRLSKLLFKGIRKRLSWELRSTKSDMEKLKSNSRYSGSILKLKKLELKLKYKREKDLLSIFDQKITRNKPGKIVKIKTTENRSKTKIGTVGQIRNSRLRLQSSRITNKISKFRSKPSWIKMVDDTRKLKSNQSLVVMPIKIRKLRSKLQNTTDKTFKESPLLTLVNSKEGMRNSTPLKIENQVPFRLKKGVKSKKINQSSYQINRWKSRNNNNTKGWNKGSRNRRNWPRFYNSKLKGSQSWTKGLLNQNDIDTISNLDQILIKEFRSIWKIYRGEPEYGVILKWRDKLARKSWLNRKRQYNKSQTKLLKYCQLLIIKTIHLLKKRQDSTGIINYIWQIKAWIKFLINNPKLLDHLLFIKENVLNKTDLLSGWHKEMSTLHPLTNLELKLLTLIWLGVYDYLFFIQEQDNKWKGMRIILSGRVSYRKMGRARRSIKYWGRTKFADSKYPLQYTEKQIHTKFGVIGLKIFLR